MFQDLLLQKFAIYSCAVVIGPVSSGGLFCILLDVHLKSHILATRLIKDDRRAVPDSGFWMLFSFNVTLFLTADTISNDSKVFVNNFVMRAFSTRPDSISCKDSL